MLTGLLKPGAKFAPQRGTKMKLLPNATLPPELTGFQGLLKGIRNKTIAIENLVEGEDALRILLALDEIQREPTPPQWALIILTEFRTLIRRSFKLAEPYTYQIQKQPETVSNREPVEINS